MYDRTSMRDHATLLGCSLPGGVAVSRVEEPKKSPPPPRVRVMGVVAPSLPVQPLAVA